MSSLDWTHSICLICWYEREPGREPVKILDAEEETCCVCGLKSRSGVYFREDPETLRCKGKHEGQGRVGVMDEKIRAKVEQLADKLVCCTYSDGTVHAAIEAALTKVGDEQWDARGEADAKACAEVGRNSTTQVRKFIQAFPVRSNHIGQFFANAVKAIRRLKRSKADEKENSQSDEFLERI